jgi:hypothetical protein
MSESEPNQEELKRDGIDSLLKLEDNSNDFVSVGWSGVFCLDLARANF